ncbi:MAG: hypothetical protein H6622_11960 [Halobacteriovoraceae bacterium]|nr:hypothetical protein [Halobacteriovoraceae bacterium]
MKKLNLIYALFVILTACGSDNNSTDTHQQADPVTQYRDQMIGQWQVTNISFERNHFNDGCGYNRLYYLCDNMSLNTDFSKSQVGMIFEFSEDGSGRVVGRYQNFYREIAKIEYRVNGDILETTSFSRNGFGFNGDVRPFDSFNILSVTNNQLVLKYTTGQTVTFNKVNIQISNGFNSMRANHFNSFHQRFYGAPVFYSRFRNNYIQYHNYYSHHHESNNSLQVGLGFLGGIILGAVLAH